MERDQRRNDDHVSGASRVTVVQPVEAVQAAALYCDQDDCPRHLVPFESERQRKSHRFAAHGTRTDRPDSIARRERRVRTGIIEELENDLAGRNDVAERQAELLLGIVGAVLAKRGILIAPQQLTTPPAPHPTIRPEISPERQAALAGDESEYVRRRMVHVVTVLAVELQRFPADVLNSITDHCHRRLYPRGINAVSVDADMGYGSAAVSDKRARREPLAH
jgi:hypothetical protein